MFNNFHHMNTTIPHSTLRLPSISLNSCSIFKIPVKSISITFMYSICTCCQKMSYFDASTNQNNVLVLNVILRMKY